jgi:hypothetical protein
VPIDLEANAAVPTVDALEGEPAWNELNDVTYGYEAGTGAISCSAMLETMRSSGRATTTP